MGKRKDFKIIQKEFLEKNYELISNKDDYKNNKTKLKFICPIHSDEGIQTISYARFSLGSGCKFCGLDRKRLKIEDIRKKFEERNLILLEQKYINNVTQMKFVCKKHPDKIQTMRYANFKVGDGCHYCSVEKRSRENNYRWQGGISNLNIFLRLKIIPSWREESLKFYNYKCVITEEGGTLQVHHAYSFNKIVEETLYCLGLPIYEQINGYSEEELKLIEIKFIELHYKYGLGFPVKKEIHRLFHTIYGRKNNNLIQFEEFKKRYLQGEFKEVC